jgi:hypothetical protein
LKTFAGSGHAVLKGADVVGSLARIPVGGPAVFSDPCPTPPRFESRPLLFSAFAESGEASPLATARSLGFTYLAPTIDGDRDPGFGHHGRVIPRRRYRVAEAFAVDAEGRPILAEESGMVDLRRFLRTARSTWGSAPGEC